MAKAYDWAKPKFSDTLSQSKKDRYKMIFGKPFPELDPKVDIKNSNPSMVLDVYYKLIDADEIVIARDGKSFFGTNFPSFKSGFVSLENPATGNLKEYVSIAWFLANYKRHNIEKTKINKSGFPRLDPIWYEPEPVIVFTGR